jgi:hypothetical protein
LSLGLEDIDQYNDSKDMNLAEEENGVFLPNKHGVRFIVSNSADLHGLCMTHAWTCVDFKGKPCK